jgi:enoyl-CoA hydratase/carnithine racemase
MTQEGKFETYDPARHDRDTPQSTFGPVVRLDKLADGKIYVITMNRPHRMNSIGDGLSEGLYEAFVEFRDDPSARVAILTGAGDRAFCAGADLIATSEARKGEAAAPGGPPTYRAPRGTKNIVPLAEGLNLWKPTIAAINGYAIAGGFMYAMQCDIRVMAEHARVGIGEARWNMSGANWMIPVTRQIGLGSALELILWGDTQYDAQRCYQLGWAQRVVPQAQLMETAMEYAQRALVMAPRAVRNFKEAMYRGYYMEPLVADAYGRGLEQNLIGMQDSIEGPTAFAEKRAPRFTDS